jgi:glycosyltransferase involved in cell wall biosynthesis
MKTIAIDIRLIGKERTGDETVFLNLTRELLLLDRENRYLLLTDEVDPARLAEIRAKLGCEASEHARVVPLLASSRFAWNLFVLPLYLFRNRIDVFHTQYILPLLIPKRTKVVVHIHDVSFRVFPELIGWKDRFFLSLLIPRTMVRSDLLIAPSEFTKAEIVKYYGVNTEKVVVVPNAVAPEFTREITDVALLRVKRKYKLPERFFLAVGTLQPRKNIPLFLRAFASVRDRIAGAQIVLVGNKSAHHYDRDIDRIIEEKHLGVVVLFPGFVEGEDLPAVYRLATAFIAPSRYEGFGIPILEAFASGVPVAASGIPPFLEVGGNAMLTFDPDTVAECGETLYTLFTDETLRKRLIQGGNERLQAYSWAESARVLLSFYRRLFE